MGPFLWQTKSSDSSLYRWLILLVFFLEESQPQKISLLPHRSSHSVKLGGHVTGIYPEGTDLTLLCESSSTSRIKTITWVKNGATVTPNSKQMISSDGKKLMLKKVKFADSGKYACNVTVDGMAAVTSKELKLWVGKKPEITGYPPEVMQFMLWEQNIFLTCIVEGVPYPRVNWYFSGGPNESQIAVPNDKTNFYVFDNGTMVIRKFIPAVYKCVAMNILGSSERTIHVQTPMTIEVQRDVLAVQGWSFNWSCRVEGLPKPKVFWADKKKDPIREGNRFITKFPEELRIRELRMSDTGRYYCVAYRNETREFKWTELRLNVYETDSLTIKSSPKNITHAFIGKTLTLRCEFDSKAPLTIKWGIKGLEEFPDYYRMQDYGSTFEITDVGESDNAQYYCSASNGFKTVTVYTHLSTYKSTEWNPSNITVYVGGSVWFHCDAQETPRFPFKVAWLKTGQGSKMLDKKRFHVIANGSIHITDIRLSDEGKYFCMSNTNLRQTFGTRYLLVRENPNGPDAHETPRLVSAARKEFRSHFSVLILVIAVIYTLFL